MKKSLIAILLVATLVMSCFCSVSAASMTKDKYMELFGTLLSTTDIEVPVDIAGRKGTDTYDDLITAKVDDSASFKAEIGMAKVKAHVEDFLTEAKTALIDTANGETAENSEEYGKFAALEVTGNFTITATWTGVEAPADVFEKQTIIDGFTGLGDIFEVFSVTKKADNELEAVIKVKDDTKVTKLAELPEDIALEIDGFTVVGDGDPDGDNDGEMSATIEGTTQILNPLSTSYDVKYKFVQKDSEPVTEEITPVVIDVRKPSSGGSVSLTTYYTLKYETNGGTAYADESKVEGRTVELTKVPEKEGFAFAGWYSDAELTNKITSVVMDGDKTVYAAWIGEGEPGSDIAHPTPDNLNGEDHIAYIHGYPDGTVRPTANITRAEVATIFFRLLKNEVRADNLTEVNEFDDVNDGDWFNTAVSTMAKLGIVEGRAANTFAPDEYITRAEFATICARFDDANEKCEECNFTDISGHWAEDYILEALAYKWIEGYGDNTFRPDNFITRAEAATLINRVLVRLPKDKDALVEGMKVWPDNSESEWYYVAIQEATNSHTYGRIDAVNEQWNALIENIDWTVYED